MIAALYRVRDEADIIGASITRMLTQVDHVMVLDNGSTDGTREILEELDVEVIDDPELTHYQSRRMSWLAAQAANRGAEWVLACDADEVWYSPHGRVADVLNGLDGAVAPAQIFNHRATALDDLREDPITRSCWRERDPLPLQKVACRPALRVTIGEGNHAAHYPGSASDAGQIEIRHFPYRSVEQFVRKARNGAAALAATDLPESVGTHWRGYGRILASRGPEGIAEIFHGHYYSEDPENDPRLIFDPAP